jgi:hypothetical protein
MISRMDVADVGRLYDMAVADNALVEIELDTPQLRAISDEEAHQLLAGEYPHSWDRVTEDDGDPEFARSLEALLRLSWPVWKANS